MLPEKPHIILIMTDQQRFDTIAGWGYDYMITPNMDRIASEGVSFRQAYCPGATCIASRAAIFTGMYAHNTGAYSFDHWGDHRNWVQDLADNGYQCVNIGKMHFSPRDVPGGFHDRVVVENPTNMTQRMGGADDDWGRYLSLHGQERPNERNSTDPDWLEKNQGVPWHLDEHLHSDVFIGNSAVAWIDNYRGDKPIFLQIGLTGPHEPWDPLPRHLDLYQDTEMPPRYLKEGELAEKPPQHQTHLEFHASTGHESQIDLRNASDAEIADMKRHYFAKITTVDEQVGRVLDSLEEARGWLENSLLIFCSDHGELLGDHGLAYKWLTYDPIVHIPLIIRHPGSVDAPGEVTDLVSLMDLGPTILAAAGVDVPTNLEGRSLLPYLKGEAIVPRKFVFCEDNYQIMMRSETDKLVYYIGQEEGELYDLTVDLHELDNLWDRPDHAALKQGLLVRLMSWFTSSTYWNAGYRRNRSRHYVQRWTGNGDAQLHGGPQSMQDKQNQVF